MNEYLGIYQSSTNVKEFWQQIQCKQLFTADFTTAQYIAHIEIYKALTVSFYNQASRLLSILMNTTHSVTSGPNDR